MLCVINSVRGLNDALKGMVGLEGFMSENMLVWDTNQSGSKLKPVQNNAFRSAFTACLCSTYRGLHSLMVAREKNLLLFFMNL